MWLSKASPDLISPLRLLYTCRDSTSWRIWATKVGVIHLASRISEIMSSEVTQRRPSVLVSAHTKIVLLSPGKIKTRDQES